MLNSKSESSQKKIAAKATRDLLAINRQIIRFSCMAPKERMGYIKKNRNEAFCHIPHPQGFGSIFCGEIGISRFWKLSKLVLEFDPTLENRTQIANVKRTLTDVYVERILKEKENVDSKIAMQILVEVSEKLRGSLKNTDHFLPCILFPRGGPDEFQVGPVTFTRTKKFFKDKKNALRDSLDGNIEAQISQVNAWADKTTSRKDLMTNADSVKFVRNHYARAIKAYRGYPWVAQVKVIQCDAETAEGQAVKAVDAALNVIRILLGAKATSRIRLAWSRGDALRTAGMWATEFDQIRITTSSRSLTPVGVENWHEGLSGEGSFLSLLGSAISPLANPRAMFHLHHRLLDSIHWFGDAATELEAASQIVKFTSGIERLIFGKYERGHGGEFAARIRAVLNCFEDYQDVDFQNDPLKVYEARSALLHGEWSPRDKSMQEIAAIAERLCSLCVLCMCELMPRVVRKDGNVLSAEWDNLMKTMSKDGPAFVESYGYS